MGDFDKQYEVEGGVEGAVTAYKNAVSQVIMDSNLRQFSEIVEKVTENIEKVTQDS